MTKNEWPKDVGVLVPAYQSADSLKLLLPDLLAAVPAGNVLVVDDGSTDATVTVCRGLGVECRRHDTNLGKGSALATGFAFLLAKGASAVITMDADRQHAVSDLPAFIARFKERGDAGIIIGRRSFRPGRMPLARICSNAMTSRILSWICGVPILDSQCGYRLYAARFLKEITITCPRFEMESEVIIKAARLSFPVLFVDVQTLYFRSASHISHVADTLRWIKATVGIWRLLNARQDKKG